MIAAVKHNGWVLEYASEALRADREVVMIAVNINGLALEYASDVLRQIRCCDGSCQKLQ